MRPIRRNISPNGRNYTHYSDAKIDLISRIGSGWLHGSHLASYCSYCERPISTNLAVEHIKPKNGPHGRPNLELKWENFLLACVNCNSTKSSKKVAWSNFFLPDRDNTFYAFKYEPDGSVLPSDVLISASDIEKAQNTLSLVGLDKDRREILDEHNRLISEDRASQNMQPWLLAQNAKEKYLRKPHDQDILDLIMENIVLNGHFSIWMTVFHDIPMMKRNFINAFSGTLESGCFDQNTLDPISPAPNPDNLPFGGKI